MDPENPVERFAVSGNARTIEPPSSVSFVPRTFLQAAAKNSRNVVANRFSAGESEPRPDYNRNFSKEKN